MRLLTPRNTLPLQYQGQSINAREMDAVCSENLELRYKQTHAACKVPTSLFVMSRQIFYKKVKKYFSTLNNPTYGNATLIVYDKKKSNN